jgi:serine/threonine protein kinase
VTHLTSLSYTDKPTGNLPSKIGHYQIVKKIAKGGMAETYLALSGEVPGLRALAVVKRILPHLSSKGQFVRMFCDEARIGTLLDHPNIARIIEVGRDEGGYFLAMEPVQGKPLSAVLHSATRSKRALTHAETAFIVGQAANGLGYAHALTDAEGRLLNVVHRDVSPQNILVSFDGAVKVIDFGIASALGRLTETVPGGLKGKIEYMSPEQVAGGAVDRRSDVFALGVVLWEALYGQRLFHGSDLEMMRAIVDEPIPSPPRNVSIAPRLERIISRALQKDPKDRFQDAREMALRLQQHAFATEGFDLICLSTKMRLLFPADYAGWKATASAAANIETRRPPKASSVRSTFAHSFTSPTEPTVALFGTLDPDIARLLTLEKGSGEGGERSGPRRASLLALDQQTWRWIWGAVALVGFVCTVTGLLSAHPRRPHEPSVAAPTKAQTPMVLVPILPLVPVTSAHFDLEPAGVVDSAGDTGGRDIVNLGAPTVPTAPVRPDAPTHRSSGANRSVRKRATRSAGGATSRANNLRRRDLARLAR